MLDVMILITQTAFCVSYIAFMVSSLHTTLDYLLGLENTSPWLYATPLVCILTLLAWVRKISKFSFSFMLGTFMILLAVVVTSAYAISVLISQGNVGPELKQFN